MKKRVFVVAIIALFALASCKSAVINHGSAVTSDVVTEGSAALDPQTENASSTETTGSETSGTPVNSDSSALSTVKPSAESVKTTAASGKTAADKRTSTTVITRYPEVKNVVREQAIKLKLTKEVLERAIVNAGNKTRVANAIKKALRGEPVTVGVIGGSITQGFKATSPVNSYAEKLRSWWEATFPASRLTFVNAGMGSTDSLIGVHRVADDLLNRHPDLVVVEFSVNDTINALYRESYESLIRRILKQNNNPGVIMLAMMNQNGENTLYIDQPIGLRYKLPIISYKAALWPTNGSKLYQWSEISPDSVHPNDIGHAIVSELLIYYLNSVRAELNSIPTTVSALPTPMTGDGFENGTILTHLNTTPVSLGAFHAANTYAQFPNGWTANGGSNPIVFEIANSKNLYILYHVTTSGAGGKATVKVDGKYVGSMNADFSGGWGDYTGIFEALKNGNNGMHRVEIQLSSGSTFSVLGIMKS